MILVEAHPNETSLTRLEDVAFTKVTNRISKCRAAAKPLGWDIKNRLEHTRFNGKPVTRSWYRIIRRVDGYGRAVTAPTKEA